MPARLPRECRSEQHEADGQADDEQRLLRTSSRFADIPTLMKKQAQ